MQNQRALTPGTDTFARPLGAAFAARWLAMLSIPHLIIIFVVALVVFGPEKLPELARTLGKVMGEFRRATGDLRSTFEGHMRDIEREAAERRASNPAPSSTPDNTSANTIAPPRSADSPASASAAPPHESELSAQPSAAVALSEPPAMTPAEGTVTAAPPHASSNPESAAPGGASDSAASTPNPEKSPDGGSSPA